MTPEKRVNSNSSLVMRNLLFSYCDEEIKQKQLCSDAGKLLFFTPSLFWDCYIPL